MFDFSWSEMAVVLLVALVVIGPEELPAVIKAAKRLINQAKAIAREFTAAFDEMAEGTEIKKTAIDLKAEADRINREVKYIVDLEGKPQRTYDVSELFPNEKTAEPVAHNEDTIAPRP